MNMKRLSIFVITFVVSLSFLIVVYAKSEDEDSKKISNCKLSNCRLRNCRWEYKIYTEDGHFDFSLLRQNNSDTVKEFEKKLNELGEQGWEFILIGEKCAIFKRVKI